MKRGKTKNQREKIKKAIGKVKARDRKGEGQREKRVKEAQRKKRGKAKMIN